MKKLSVKNILIGSLNIIVETSVYFLANMIVETFGLSFQAIKIDVIDNLFIFNKYWIIPYCLSYGFWVIAGAIINTTNKKDANNYLIAMFISVFIGGIIFLVYPTRMDRIAEGIYAKLGNDFISNLFLFLINNDGGQFGINLLPSFHCLVSTLCVLGTLKMKEVNKEYKVFTIIFSIIIYFSTLFTKQHYIVDVIAGVVIPTLVFIIVTKVDVYSKIKKI